MPKKVLYSLGRQNVEAVTLIQFCVEAQGAVALLEMTTGPRGAVGPVSGRGRRAVF